MKSKYLIYTETNALVKDMLVLLSAPIIVRKCKGKKIFVENNMRDTYWVDDRYIQVFPSNFSLTKSRPAAFVAPKIGKSGIYPIGAAAIWVMPAIVKSSQTDMTVKLMNAERRIFNVHPRFIRYIPYDFPFNLDRKEEFVTTEKGSRDYWICACKTNVMSYEYMPCDAQGNEIDPLINSGWDYTYVCLDCGRIVHQDTLKIVGRNPKFAWL